MATLEELISQFKALPDYDRYPLPEVYYDKYGFKKPKPGTFLESVLYQAPPHENLNTNGKVEVREILPGGVREITDFQVLPTEVKLLKEDTNELVDYPPPDPAAVERAKLLSYCPTTNLKYFEDFDAKWKHLLYPAKQDTTIQNISFSTILQSVSYTPQGSDQN